MSRITPPPPSTPSGSPDQPNKRPAAAGPGMPAQKPNLTTPKAPELGASAPPTTGGQPANKTVVPGSSPSAPASPTQPAGGNGSAAAKPAPAKVANIFAPKTGAAGGAGVAPAAPAPTSGGAAGSGMPAIAELKQRPIGRVLTKMGKVTREQVVEALGFQKSKGGALGRILIDLGYIKESDLNIALAAQQGYEMVSLEGRNITPQMVEAVPAQLATTQKVLPIEFDKATKKLTVAMASHENFRAIDDLRALMGYDVQAVLAEPSELERLINKHYQSAAQGIGDILSELNTDDSLKDMKNRGESIDLDTLKEA